MHAKVSTLFTSRILFLAMTSLLWASSTMALEDPPKLETDVPFKVIDTLNSGGFTYAQLDVKGTKYWIAGPLTPIKKGDGLILGSNFRMKDYQSPTLNKTFKSVYFCSKITVEGKSASSGEPLRSHGMTSSHPPMDKAKSKAKADLSKVVKADMTIEELNRNKDAQKGKTVKIRGVVTKYSPGIMGKNWIHITDASVKAAIKPLTVTTDQTSSIGQTILVEGTVRLDMDLGYGYLYPILLEDAKITAE